MPSESRRRAQILDRGWSLYLWLTDAFNLPETFHIEFPAAAEATFLTGAFQIVAPLTNQFTFSLREEYALGGQELEISRYSYVEERGLKGGPIWLECSQILPHPVPLP